MKRIIIFVLTAVILLSMGGCTKTVSYTHLDVYKRQKHDYSDADCRMTAFLLLDGLLQACLLYTSSAEERLTKMMSLMQDDVDELWNEKYNEIREPLDTEIPVGQAYTCLLYTSYRHYLYIRVPFFIR